MFPPAHPASVPSTASSIISIDTDSPTRLPHQNHGENTTHYADPPLRLPPGLHMQNPPARVEQVWNRYHRTCTPPGTSVCVYRFHVIRAPAPQNRSIFGTVACLHSYHTDPRVPMENHHVSTFGHHHTEPPPLRPTPCGHRLTDLLNIGHEPLNFTATTVFTSLPQEALCAAPAPPEHTCHDGGHNRSHHTGDLPKTSFLTYRTRSFYSVQVPCAFKSYVCHRFTAMDLPFAIYRTTTHWNSPFGDLATWDGYVSFSCSCVLLEVVGRSAARSWADRCPLPAPHFLNFLGAPYADRAGFCLRHRYCSLRFVAYVWWAGSHAAALRRRCATCKISLFGIHAHRAAVTTEHTPL